MSKHVLQRAIEALGIDVRSYSGRGMFGKSCLGVEIDPGDSVTEFSLGVDVGIWLQENDEDYNSRDFKSSSDSMGLGTIVYFPYVPYTEDDEDNHHCSQDCDCTE